MTEGIRLVGLDGSNPLAFLAALGTLRTLAHAWPKRNVRLGWAMDTAWRPVIHADGSFDSASLLDALDVTLRNPTRQGAFLLADDLKFKPEDFRKHAIGAASSPDRLVADFVVAFACDATCTDDGLVQDTALRTMSGAGHQHFLQFMRDLAAETTADHLRGALIERWAYAEPGPSLRWDPADDRRYALRWKEPSGDPICTVRGANRLAIEGMPLVPTAPVGGDLKTTGFSGRGSRDTFWTWPIWTHPVGVDTVKSLLTLGKLQAKPVPRDDLAAIGIVEVFRSQRLTIGKYRNFTPGRPA